MEDAGERSAALLVEHHLHSVDDFMLAFGLPRSTDLGEPLRLQLGRNDRACDIMLEVLIDSMSDTSSFTDLDWETPSASALESALMSNIGRQGPFF